MAGLITSLHCAGMCGPLACALMPAQNDRSDPQTVSTVYHVTRLTGYMVLGAVAGGLGRMPLTWVTGSALRWLPWVLVFYFAAMAFQWDRFVPKPAALGRFSLQISRWIRGRPRVQAAAALGLATPLLPCGPLYFLLALATLATGQIYAGSPASAYLLMAGMAGAGLTGIMIVFRMLGAKQ